MTAPDERPRFPAVARACLYLNGLFLVLWGIYLLGPDASGWLLRSRDSLTYRLFVGAFFLLHFVVMSTGIIALFVVIIEIHARRPFRGFRSVLLALALPMSSFVYFAARFLLQVKHWTETQR